MKGTGVQDFGSALDGMDEKDLRLLLRALRAGARSIRAAIILKRERLNC